MSSEISEPQSGRRDRPKVSLVLKVLAWSVVIALSLVATFIIMVFLGFATVLASWGLWEATFGEDVVAKYWVLFGWTLMVLVLASAIRLIVLFRARNRHMLRWDEYIDHMFTTGVLSGGLAYGAIAVVVAAFGALAVDLETIGDASDETLGGVALLAGAPILIAMLAAFLTLQKKPVEIPETAPRSKELERMLRPLRFLGGQVKNRVLRRIRSGVARSKG